MCIRDSRYSERVDIDPMEGVESLLDSFARIEARGVDLPVRVQASKGTKQEMRRPARSVNDLQTSQAKLANRWFEGLVEDELLDEDWGLQQRELLFGEL